MAYGKEFDFQKQPWESLLFLDVETAARVLELEEDTDLYEAFVYKMRYTEEAQRKDFNSYNVKALFSEKAALYPEFGRIVCITVGKIVNDKIVLYTFADDDELTLLTKFNKFLGDRAATDPNLALCGVNLKFFDLRYIYIRSVVNQVVPVKGHIDLTGLKPWEVRTADLTDYWKQTSSYNAPLVAMAECLGLPSPKAKLDGSQVSKVYHTEGKEGLARIVGYCEKDVVTTVNIARKLRFEPILEVEGQEPEPTKDKAVKKATVVKKEVVKKEPPKAFNTELPPLLQRMYNLNMFDDVMEKELKTIIGRKKLTKVDKDNLRTILTGVYLRTDFVNRDQDTKTVKEQKIEQIDNFLNTL